MASIYDVEPIKLIDALVKELEKNPSMKMPEWAQFVKTGAHVERPPVQEDWWYIRSSALLRTIYKDGPVGVSKLRTKYGGRKNRGVKPHRLYKASGKIIRTMLQQLEKAGYVQQAKQGSKGRIVTSQGQALLDNAANQILGKSKKTKAVKEPKTESKVVKTEPSNKSKDLIGLAEQNSARKKKEVKESKTETKVVKETKTPNKEKK
jgi:small subunit ribosomal protein S19e